MRFAWLHKQSGHSVSARLSSTHPISLIRMAYNAAFWIFLLPFLTAMAYSTGFIVFTILIFVRLGANLYVNFVNLQPEQFDVFPLRMP
jgi:hypothetical protein